MFPARLWATISCTTAIIYVYLFIYVGYMRIYQPSIIPIIVNKRRHMKLYSKMYSHLTIIRITYRWSVHVWLHWTVLLRKKHTKTK
jgi:hypothetical protein